MAKTVNYTPEMTKELVAAYTAAGTEESRDNVLHVYAEKFGKNVQSVRQKLSREGVYKKKVRTTKDGEPVENKATILQEIADLIEEPVDTLDSMSKTNKNVLQLVRDILKNWKPEEGDS